MPFRTVKRLFGLISFLFRSAGRGSALRNRRDWVGQRRQQKFPVASIFSNLDAFAGFARAHEYRAAPFFAAPC